MRKVTVVSTDAVGFIRARLAKKGKGICLMGGGELARFLLEGVDEIVLNIHPVLLGSGIPLFLPLLHQIELELGGCDVLQKGCVCVTYRAVTNP